MGLKFTAAAILCLALAVPVFSETIDPFSTRIEWNLLDYLYDSSEQRQADIDSGNYVQNASAPIDVDVWLQSTIPTVFVTTPRFQPGIPAALSTVVLDDNKQPILKPFPSWEWFQNATACKDNRITSVFRIMIDECDRLWVLDNGIYLNEIICSPQILAFDLKTNKLIHKYEIPNGQYNTSSNFVTPAVDVLSKKDNCKNTFVYAADSTAAGLVVYDVNANKSWRIEDPTMLPDTTWGTYNITGISFYVLDGILGLAISKNNKVNDRKLFFHAMSSNTEHWVYTRDIRNESLFINNTDVSEYFHSKTGTRDTQSAAEAIDQEGVMYYGLLGDIEIGCWNTNGEYGTSSNSTDIVGNNQTTLQFPSGMKVKKYYDGEEVLLFVTSRFQKVATGQLVANEVNFRIQSAFVKDVKSGTKCENRRN